MSVADSVIFLDVDGVLNAYEPRDGYDLTDMYPLWRPLVRRFCALVRVAEASVVLSSTWRLNEDAFGEVADAIDRHIGIELDVTPHIGTMRQYQRGDEIANWIATNDFRGRYVILDDWDDFPPEMHANFVQTDGKIGLTKADTKRALAILRGDA